MFSVPHLVIIFVVALVVFGPEKLPDLARNLGKVMGEFRRATGDLRSTFENHMRDLEREAELRKARDRFISLGAKQRTPGVIGWCVRSGLNACVEVDSLWVIRERLIRGLLIWELSGELSSRGLVVRPLLNSLLWLGRAVF